MQKALLILISLFFLNGCMSSSATMDDLEIPLAAIKRAISDGVPLGVRDLSSNGRTYLSHYYAYTKSKKFIRAEDLPKRYYAEVVVYGDMRPYKVVVTVRKEIRSSVASVIPEYSDLGPSKKHSKMVARRIAKALSKRRKDVNIIDDFRIF